MVQSARRAQPGAVQRWPSVGFRHPEAGIRRLSRFETVSPSDTVPLMQQAPRWESRLDVRAAAEPRGRQDRTLRSAVIDTLLHPLVYPAALVLKAVRQVGLGHLPRCRQALLNVGVLPIGNHYYEPLFDTRYLKRPLDSDRPLPAIHWNAGAQLALLDRFHYQDELNRFPREKSNGKSYFYYNNRYFGSGDAEYWYSIIRTLKPARLFEIGSGKSTILAAAALEANAGEDSRYTCRHVCIEPYENGWLEKLGVTVIREKVEDVGVEFFAELEENDILFIDSSHIIRPQGDVLFEYLEVLPSLARGVIVHIHDIFSPKDYPKRWIIDEVRLWNEQYLLEAFLSHNPEWEIVGALNYLKHHHYAELEAKCPFLTADREPASFYIRKR